MKNLYLHRIRVGVCGVRVFVPCAVWREPASWETRNLKGSRIPPRQKRWPGGFCFL